MPSSSLIKINYKDVSLEISTSELEKVMEIIRQAKILEVEYDDIWLYQNRLNDARFIFPKCDKTVKISSSELKIILKSIALISC